eukprot:Hpha_TRINITY_DN31535_c0_g1::TRINITY_DN31535_c0_g1_i1::g.1631::m.1631
MNGEIRSPTERRRAAGRDDVVLDVVNPDALRAHISPGVPMTVPLSQLTVLDLNHSSITSFGAHVVRSLRSLEMLLLAGNFIQDLSGVFDHPPPQLWVVDVSHNPALRELPPSVGTACLGVLRLDGTAVDGGALECIKGLKCVEVTLSDTPLEAEHGEEGVLR